MLMAVIAKRWKQPKCSLVGEQIKRMQYIYAMESYSATKKDNVTISTAWADVQDIMVSEIS